MPPSGHNPAQVDDVPNSFGLSGESEDWIDRVREAEAPATLGCIGPYELIEEVSRGGQGIVYRARQPGTKREIVVKRLLAGAFATPVMLRRFEREVELAASLSHPNIVTVFGIEIVDGQPLLAMEWIDGVPIDKWAASGDTERRSPNQIAALMHEVCGAVHHAHQRGIIHRDLKPSNILVDRNGVPRVLDFGLARPVDAEADRGQTVTLTEQFVGTPAYASPEQLRGGTGAIDVRADVYSLGLILYQALTGNLPYDVSGDLPDVFQRIEHAEPIRPSTVVPHLDRDIESIVLKALAKEKERRYQSADLLAKDLRRYVDGESVLAHPPGTFYQLRKLAKRHRLALALALGAFVVLLAFSVTVSYQASRISEQRDLARDAADKAVVQAAKAETLTQFLQEMLASVDPAIARGSDVTVLKQMLDDAARRAKVELSGQPEVAATVYATIGTTYKVLARYDEAGLHLREALQTRRELFGDHHADVAASKTHLASLLHAEGGYEESEQMFREALRTQQELFGCEHATVAATQHELGVLLVDRNAYDAAEAMFRQSLDTRRRLFSTRGPEVAESLHGLGTVLQAKGQYADADQLYREALLIKREVFGRLHPSVARTLNKVAAVAKSRGEYAEAEELYRQALDLHRGLLDEDHPDLAAAHNNLAAIVESRGDHVAAEALFRQALDIYRRRLEPNHPRITSTLGNLANVLRTKGDYEESRRMFEESIELLRERLGDEHIRVVSTRNNLAGLLLAMDERDAAADEYQEVLRVLRKLVGEEHEYVAVTMNNLAIVHQAREDYDAAETLYRAALSIWRKEFGDEHHQVAAGLQNLASLHVARENYAAAEPLYRDALAMRRSLLGERHPDVAITLDNLGSMLQDTGDFAAAEPLHLEALSIRREALGEHNPKVAYTLHWLGQLQLRIGNPGNAETYLRDALAIFSDTLPDDHTRALNSQRLLGRSLTALREYTEAEAILLDNLHKSQGSTRTVEALVELYGGWGKPAKADEYRALLSRER